MKKRCEFCGKEFIANRKEAKFCSTKCSGMARRKRVKVVCQHCNKEFEETVSGIKSGRGKYCSKKCMYVAHGEIIDRECRYCGRPFKTPLSRIKDNRGKYCSKTCFNKARSEFEEYLGDNHHNWKGDECNRVCSNCDKIYRFVDGDSALGEHTFCSRQCFHEFMRGVNHPLWQGGISFEPYSEEFNKTLKLKIRKRDNYICRECGYSEKQLMYRLSVHHIDYDKTNNLEINLISLCKSCHMKTNFNREIWEQVLKEYQEVRFS